MKYIEKNVPESLRVEVHHNRLPTHPKARYETVCILRDRRTGEMLARATSRCSLKDQPSRKVGRAIAVGRALKQYEMAMELLPF